MSERQSGNGGRAAKSGARCGAKAGAKSLGTGSITINGMRQRFVIFRKRSQEGGQATSRITR
jgi:hypothetical protein